MVASPSSPYGSRGSNNPRVLIACTNCRNQHLRCDAVMPRCTRCTSLNKQCVYTDLRRSKRRSSLAPTMSHQQAATTTPPDDADPFLLEPAEIASLMPTLAYKASASVLEQTSVFALNPRLDAFYAWFFPCHPFVLPRAKLLAQDDSALSVLVPAIELIGSHYAGSTTTEEQKLLLLQLLSGPLAETGFTVQALLLLALTLEWTGESDNAEQTLSRAKTMALSICMNQHEFATDNANSDPVVAESWRRTWWELFVVDCLFAGIRHYPTFELYNREYNVRLPCEEVEYASLRIPSPRTLDEYDNREFDNADIPFSSYAYLIDAARMHGPCLAAGDVAGKSPIELVKITEANILSWHLHLPERKRDPVCDDGSVDEVLFRAHLGIQTVATHLHRPRSALHYSTMELLCSKYAPPLPGETIPPRDRQPDKHTHKAIQAARAFVDILAVPSPPIAHSPFVMCMGAMAIATHLSACEYLLQGSEYTHAKDRVRVFLGLLKAFDGIWPTSAKWSGEIKMMAKAVFDGRNAQGQLLASTGSSSLSNDDTNMLLDGTYILDI